MSKSKNKNFLSEIESFFQKNSDSAIQAITRAIKAMKFTGRIPTLKTKHNASVKTSEKLVSLLLLPFFGCKDVSHLGTSPACKWLKVGYNMLYRLLREDKIDWRKVMEHVSRRVGKYIDGIPIRLFLCRRAKTDGWKALLTTNTKNHPAN